MRKERNSTAVRTCVGCGTKSQREGLLRWTIVGDELLADARGTLGGRGVYTCFDRDCLKRAFSPRWVSRRLRPAGLTRRVTLPPLTQRLAQATSALYLATLGQVQKLCHRGVVSRGVRKVVASLRTHNRSVVLQLADCSVRSLQDVFAALQEREGLFWSWPSSHLPQARQLFGKRTRVVGIHGPESTSVVRLWTRVRSLHTT